MNPIKAIVLALIAFSVPAVFAQAPANTGDDLRVTMRTIANPDAIEPDEIVRKIPARKPKKPRQETDDPTNDLASPGRNGEQDAGGTAADPVTPGPIIPGDPGIPDEVGPGSGPDPREHTDDLGRRVSDDSRHHGEDAHRNAHGPQGPRSDKPPGPKGPGAKPPGPKPPGHKPPGPKPPGGRPPGPRHGPGPRG
jgi:hypothetical protein